MTYDEIDNLLETILFEDTVWIRLILYELERDGILDSETRFTLVVSLTC